MLTLHEFSKIILMHHARYTTRRQYPCPTIPIFASNDGRNFSILKNICDVIEICRPNRSTEDTIHWYQ